jgi:hypothetical protein
LGSDFDTVMSVYRGTNLHALATVVSNDQDPAGGDTSAVEFSAHAGEEFAIAVDGIGTATGNVILSWDHRERPRLSLTAGPTGLSLAIQGGVGRRYVILSARSLSIPIAWEPVATNGPLLAPVWHLALTNQLSTPAAFYRAELLP